MDDEQCSHAVKLLLRRLHGHRAGTYNPADLEIGELTEFDALVWIIPALFRHTGLAKTQDPWGRDCDTARYGAERRNDLLKDSIGIGGCGMLYLCGNHTNQSKAIVFPSFLMYLSVEKGRQFWGKRAL